MKSNDTLFEDLTDIDGLPDSWSCLKITVRDIIRRLNEHENVAVLFFMSYFGKNIKDFF